jgi:phosphoribosylglycinamide formyltransferase-1
MNSKKNIIIFASGKGSNAAAIIEYFQKNTQKNTQVSLIVCNKPNAGVLEIAASQNIATLLIDKTIFQSEAFLNELCQHQPHLIILAGFLWKIPEHLVKAFPNQIVNIHPALLPKYGGKGMYGHHVHEAVIAAKEAESGITIHYVNEYYDEGSIILQARCNILPNDTPNDLAKKISQLELNFFPTTVDYLLQIQ